MNLKLNFNFKVAELSSNIDLKNKLEFPTSESLKTDEKVVINLKNPSEKFC